MAPDPGNTPPLGKPPPPPPPPGPIERRAYPRRRSLTPTPVGFRPAGGTISFTNLRDLSRGGVGIARTGRLDLPVGTKVDVQFQRPGSQEPLSLAAEVRWCRYGGHSTYIGLRFAEPLEPSNPILVALLPQE